MGSREVQARGRRPKGAEGPQTQETERLLTTLRVGATDIPVLEASPHVLGEGVLGLYGGYPSPVIRLLEGLEPEVRRLTLLHELLHAIEDVYGLNLGERRIRVLEQALGSVMETDRKGCTCRHL